MPREYGPVWPGGPRVGDTIPNFPPPTTNARGRLLARLGHQADDAVALLRASAGRGPYDRRLTDLIGELATRSEDFRVRWASHDVRTYVTGVKRIHRPLVGDLELPFETSPVGADPGQYLLFYTAEPDSRSHEALKIRASWSTSDQLLDASLTDTDST